MRGTFRLRVNHAAHSGGTEKDKTYFLNFLLALSMYSVYIRVYVYTYVALSVTKIHIKSPIIGLEWEDDLWIPGAKYIFLTFTLSHISQ